MLLKQPTKAGLKVKKPSLRLSEYLEKELRLRTVLDTLNRELMPIITEGNLEFVLKIKEYLQNTFENKKGEVAKIYNLADSGLLEKAKGLKIGDEFNIGLYRFRVQNKTGQSQLSETKLSQIIQDKDMYEDCFELKRKAKTQEELKLLFASWGLKVDVKSLYEAPIKKGEITVKQLN